MPEKDLDIRQFNANRPHQMKDDLEAETILLENLRQKTESGRIESTLINNLHTLAARYCLMHKYLDALRLYKMGLEIREKLLEPNHPDIVDSLERLAVVLQETGHCDEARVVSFRAQTLAAEINSLDGKGKQNNEHSDD